MKHSDTQRTLYEVHADRWLREHGTPFRAIKALASYEPLSEFDSRVMAILQAQYDQGRRR